LKLAIKFSAVIVVLLLCAAASLLFGGAVSASELLMELSGSSTDTAVSDIFWQIRLPRMLGAAASGMLLAASGCTVQLLFRNPLSSPHVLGAVNSAALGAVVVMAWFGGSALLMLCGSGAGALLAIFLLLLIGKNYRQTASLLLAGIALNAFASAAMSGILFLAGERLEGVVFWLLGGFWRLDWQSCWILLAAVGITIIVLLGGRREMNMLYLGETAAAAAGVNTRRVIVIAVLVASAATAATVAHCGVIGFVGLLVPHIARRIFGGEFRTHLLGAVLIGAWLMIAADWVGRVLFYPLEVPIGVLTSVIGAPFFLMLVIGRLKSNSGGCEQ